MRLTETLSAFFITTMYMYMYMYIHLQNSHTYNKCLIFYTQQLPYPPVTSDAFLSQLGFSLSFLLMLAFIYTFARFVKVCYCAPFLNFSVTVAGCICENYISCAHDEYTHSEIYNVLLNTFMHMCSCQWTSFLKCMEGPCTN